MKIADLTGSVRTLRVVLLSLSLGLGGCATLVYAPTGKVLTHYATDEVVPYVESTSDIPLATCGTGLGQQQLLASFGRIIGRPHMALVYTGILTAGCSEAQAFSDDLRYLRAARAGRSSDANDALIAEQNAEALTARRRYQAFRDMVAIYGKPGQESTTDSGQPGVVCPEFEGRKDQETYLLGLVTGLQAIFDDTRSGSQVGVPQNIAPEAARASQCLDNAKWWGVPEAIQAAVWSTVPGALPKGKNAWTAFAHAEQLANAAGVRLAYALAAATAENLGDDARLRQTISDFVAAGKAKPAPKAQTLIDRLAGMQLRHFSDQIWTRATGARTPVGAFGTFPGEKSKAPDIKGLLD